MDEIPNIGSATGQAIVLWIWGACGTAFLANIVLNFWKQNMREQPRPSETYATKLEVNELERKLELHKEREAEDAAKRRAGIYTKIDETRRELSSEIADVKREIKEDFHSTHERIDELTKAVSRMEGKIS